MNRKETKMNNMFTERNQLRKPIEKTYSIDADSYGLLMECCDKYKDNLIHLFYSEIQDQFTKNFYNSFNENKFETSIRVRIPTISKDANGKLCPPSYNSNFDQYAILDYIEYFACHIKDISKYWNNETYKNYKIINSLDSKEIFVQFKDEINNIFEKTHLLYILTDEYKIERIVEHTPLTKEIENHIGTIKEEGLKELLERAIILYRDPKPKSRQDSIEKLWDAFERLKTYYSSKNKKTSAKEIVNDISHNDQYYYDLFNAEFKALTDIGNTVRIRHHETDKTEIIDERYYDYFFNRCLSLLALAILYLK